MGCADLSTSCVIPAYNEASTLPAVIDRCLEAELIKQVIVVDDGSTDETREVLEPYRDWVVLEALERNHGKGYAVAQGVKVAVNELVLMLDADLINLEVDHLRSLILPLNKLETEMTVGYCHSFRYPLTSFLWQTSGQRCLRRSHLDGLVEQMEDTKYSLEMLLNDAVPREKIKLVRMSSQKPLHVPKHQKQSDWVESFIREYGEIAFYRLRSRIDFRPEEFFSDDDPEWLIILREKIEEWKDYWESF